MENIYSKKGHRIDPQTWRVPFQMLQSWRDLKNNHIVYISSLMINCNSVVVIYHYLASLHFCNTWFAPTWHKSLLWWQNPHCIHPVSGINFRFQRPGRKAQKGVSVSRWGYHSSQWQIHTSWQSGTILHNFQGFHLFLLRNDPVLRLMGFNHLHSPRCPNTIPNMAAIDPRLKTDTDHCKMTLL